MKISCLIIDDEPLARKRLYTLVTAIPEFDLLGQCKTGKEAIVKIDTLTPDLIFLDIQMKDMSGFDVLKKIKPHKKPLVIFVTAFDSYAVKAFEFLAFDYLLKPFKKERFEQSVARTLSHLKSRNRQHLDDKMTQLLQYIDSGAPPKEKSAIKNKFPIKTGNTVSFINVNEIKYILASGSYIDICTEGKKYVHRSSLQQLLTELEHEALLRIHRSTIINIHFIEKVIYSNYGEIDVKMKDDALFRISKSYRKDFQKKTGI